MNQTVIIFNPKSGSSDDDFRAQIDTALKSRGIEYSMLETTPDISGGELARQAFEDGALHLIACGGDGTVMSVVNGLGHAVEKKVWPAKTTRRRFYRLCRAEPRTC